MAGFQVLLGLSGVMLVMLSVLGSVGFFSAVGIKSTLIIMEVIPFLVLAVSSICLKILFEKQQFIFIRYCYFGKHYVFPCLSDVRSYHISRGL